MSKQWDQQIECHEVGSTRIMRSCGQRKTCMRLRFGSGWRRKDHFKEKERN